MERSKQVAKEMKAMSTVPKLTLEEYDAMIARGEFEPAEDHHVELIYGELRQMSPAGPEHEDIVDILNEWSFSNTPRGKVRVRMQNSVGVPELDSAPEPEIAWVRQKSYKSGRPLPKDVLLVIEVAYSSIDYDLGEKLDLYARAGVPEYWIVDVANQTVEVFRSPSKKGYRDTKTYAAGQTISPQAFPTAKLEVATLS